MPENPNDLNEFLAWVKENIGGERFPLVKVLMSNDMTLEDLVSAWRRGLKIVKHVQTMTSYLVEYVDGGTTDENC